MQYFASAKEVCCYRIFAMSLIIRHTQLLFSHARLPAAEYVAEDTIMYP